MIEDRLVDLEWQNIQYNRLCRLIAKLACEMGIDPHGHEDPAETLSACRGVWAAHQSILAYYR